jgi:hypothetical protein
MKTVCIFYIPLLFALILPLKNEIGNVNALIVENNPLYGQSNAVIKSVESLTDDNLINIRLEYAPTEFQVGSPEFFKSTLFYEDTNEPVLYADTDITVYKDGNELYKASNAFSQPFVHTPNGIVLSSYNFPDSGQYTITVKILGINFMQVSAKQVNFIANVTDLNYKYKIDIGK